MDMIQTTSTDTDIRERIEGLAEYCMSEIAQAVDAGGQIARPDQYTFRRIRSLAAAGIALHSAGVAMRSGRKSDYR